MPNIYIDESGSITHNAVGNDKHRWFIIALLETKDSKKLKQLHKRFIRTNERKLKRLKKAACIFNADGSFKELKGSALTSELKESFLDYFCRELFFTVSFIQVDNTLTTEKFCEDKARAFNYLIKSFLMWKLNNGAQHEDYCLQIDNRNVKTEAKNTLEDYLNIELGLHCGHNINFTVRYYDSAQNSIIQLADVFSNIFYSSVITHKYDKLLIDLMHRGFLNPLFKFPIKYTLELDKKTND